MGEAKRRKESDPEFGKVRRTFAPAPPRMGQRPYVTEVDFQLADGGSWRRLFRVYPGKPPRIYEVRGTVVFRIDDPHTLRAVVAQIVADENKRREVAAAREQQAEGDA